MTSYIDAENAHAQTLFRRLQPSTLNFFEEFSAREPDDVVSPAFLTDLCSYTLRKEKGANFPSLFRTCGLKLEKVFDPDTFAPPSQGEYALLKLSPNEKYMAFLFRPAGSSRPFELWVKDIESGQSISLGLKNVRGIEWLADSSTLVFTIDNAAMRPYALFKAALTDPLRPQKIYEEKRESFEIHLRREDKKSGVLADLVSDGSCNSIYIDGETARKFSSPIGLGQKRCSRIYPVPKGFILLEDNSAPASRVLRIDGTGNLIRVYALPWKYKIVEDVSVRQNSALLFLRHGAWQSLSLLNLESGAVQEIAQEEPLAELKKAPHTSLYSEAAVVSASSLRMPNRLMRIDIKSLQLSEIWRDTLPGYDPSQYSIKNLEYQARDGTRIPLTIVHNTATPPSSSAPLLLHTYGAYGTAASLFFSPQLASLLNRGFSYAIAHIRGGGEYGRSWHAAGQKDGRAKSISDLIDAVHFLVQNGYAAKDKVFSFSRSAGAIAALNAAYREPQLFRAMVFENPYVDPVTAMNESSRPGTLREYNEWGNPSTPADLAAMQNYSPIEQIPLHPLPPMLVFAGMQDGITPYQDTARWAAKIRSRSQGETPLFLYVSPTADHSGEENYYDTLMMKAREYAFYVRMLE